MANEPEPIEPSEPVNAVTRDDWHGFHTSANSRRAFQHMADDPPKIAPESALDAPTDKS